MTKFVRSLPTAPGVYLFRDARGRVLYVGKAKNLRRRVSSYFRPGMDHGVRLGSLVTRTVRVDHMVLGSEDEALVREAELIRELLPPYNIRLRGGKAYPVLRIGGRGDPSVRLVRQVKRDGAAYFGPCPRSGQVRGAIEVLRRLYVIRAEAFERGSSCEREAMRRMASDLRRYLLGTDARIERRLERAVRRAASRQDFHRAARLQSASEALSGLIGCRLPPEPAGVRTGGRPSRLSPTNETV